MGDKLNLTGGANFPVIMKGNVRYSMAKTHRFRKQAILKALPEERVWRNQAN